MAQKKILSDIPITELIAVLQELQKEHQYCCIFLNEEDGTYGIAALIHDEIDTFEEEEEDEFEEFDDVDPAKFKLDDKSRLN